MMGWGWWWVVALCVRGSAAAALPCTVDSPILSSDSCRPCPPHAFSSPGSPFANCSCAAGFFGPAGGPCEPCPAGTYKTAAGPAEACTPCPFPGQWSPTRSVDADDCMTVPEVCPRPPVQNFGEQQFKLCQVPWTWEELIAGYKESTISPQWGTLGLRTVPQVFESYVCIHGDPCATDLVDHYFCYVLDERDRSFVPWGPNAVLQILKLPVTQDEVLHLRSQSNDLAAAVANLTKHLSASGLEITVLHPLSSLERAMLRACVSCKQRQRD